MNRRDIEDIYPLSPMQQGMLFHSLYAPASGVYFEQVSCALHGSLNVSAFERAWQRVLDRHSSLRTAFIWEDVDQPLQAAYRRVMLPIEKHDWRGLPPAEQQTRLDAFLQADRNKGFDLAQAPLMRLGLMRTDEDVHQFVWSHHHLLLDGWSLPLLLKEVFGLYEAYRQGQDLYLEPARPYRAYVAWLGQQDQAKAEAFWRRTLKGFSAPTSLTVDHLSVSMPDAQADYAVQHLQLSRETTAALQSLGRQHQVTLNTFLQGAWALLLSRYSGEDDVMFGATVSGRPAELPGAELMVGLFINTLPVRAQVQPETSAISWLKTLQARQAELRQYEYSSLIQIQSWSDVPRGLPLFESILVFENYPVDESMREVGGSLAIRDLRSLSRTNYPLTVVVSQGSALSLEIAYDLRRFGDGTIARMLGHLKTILEGISADPDQPLSKIPWLTDAERRQLLIEWNDTASVPASAQCVHQLFETQVERTPDAVALTFEEKALTYDELNRRTNQLARYLQGSGVGPDSLVGICAERSPEMIVGVLGILKAGGAYLPLDPTHPRERLAFMLSDAQAPVLLTQARLVEHLPAHTAQTVRLDADWETISRESSDNLVCSVTLDNLAYVIYTSGSTGTPKGVMIPHSALVNHAQALKTKYGLTGDDRVLQFITLSFDAAAEEIFPTLLSGATLVLPGAATELVGDDFLPWCEDRAISVLHMPASIWNHWVDDLAARNRPVKMPLRVLLLGGDSPNIDKLQAWTRLVEHPIKFLNAYGPTEATITATVYETVCDSHTFAQLPRVPIGRPIDNVQVYLLDRRLQPVPIGVPGELHIGGAGLARGYLNRPELTAERFIENPFEKDKGAGMNPRRARASDEASLSSSLRTRPRSEAEGVQPSSLLYKTGDIARYLPDGNIEFVGRVDHQVKVRGFRIELGEIESVLSQHPTVNEAVVLAREIDGDRQLVAYVVSAGAGLQTNELRTFLQDRLPAYMVPSTFVMLDALPSLPNGKVDRRALPEPDQSRPNTDATYVAPRTPVEDILASIWARTLRVEQVGVHDNFFDLGGHSLLATQLVSRLRETFQIELPLRDLFDAPTVAGLSARVESLLRSASGLKPLPIEPVSREESLLLSFAQQRLWFLDQLAPGNLFNNIPSAVRLTGQLDVGALERSLNEIVRRHESLRTTFSEEGGKAVQVIAPVLRLALPIIDLRDVPQIEREAEALRLAGEEARQPFDLAHGPLLRASLLRLTDDEHVALLTMHHIVSDGWSMGVLVDEVATLYTAFTAGKPSPLPELSIQYGDFAHWQRGWLSGKVLDRQLAYWKEQLAGSPPMLELPTDHPRPAVQTSNGATRSFTLPMPLSQALKALSRQEGATLFMTLMAAFQTLLYRYTGQNDISVGTPIANRTRPEIENLIGFFVNTLVIRGRLSDQLSFRDLLQQARETALGAYAHQDLPFEMLVEALQPGRDMSHTPLFQVMFVLDTPAPNALRLPDLALSALPSHSGASTFDITLSMNDSPEGLGGYFEYNTDLFEELTIERMIGHWQTALEGITADPDQRLAALPLLTKSERQQVLVEWNQTAASFPHDHCAHELFEAQVEKRSDAVALTFEGEVLTYRDLNRRANQLAHHLQKSGVGPETLVGVSTERSIEMIVGVLGILKAGGAYLPLDPTYPPERLAFMLEDSRVPIVLTQARLLDQLSAISGSASVKTLCLDADWPAVASEPADNLGRTASSENLAYVIYTSGSTGKPKGAMLQHRGLCNLAQAQQRAFDIVEGSRVLQFSPFSFDASVWEIFMALANGGTLCLARQEVLASGPDLLRLLRDDGVTTVTLPPSVLAVLDAGALPELKVVIAAGEKCTREIVSHWAPGRRFFNAYGPTETTVCASMYLCDANDPQDPPIGTPIANTQLYILDRHAQPVPMGVPGELHIGGVSLARGYLNRPDLTAERFITNPFGKADTRSPSSLTPHPSSLLYKTGDLVRYRPDGNIEFLGRIDQQVKVRGFRIELGEIEAVLRQIPTLREGVVVANDNRLIAYVVPHEQPAPAVAELKSLLREQLPEYMVPSIFVMLDGLPLSPSGKVDRRALPALDGMRSDLDREYVAPRTPTEETLATLCAELLGIGKVGVHDNFFDLGGHSLLATQFISRLRDALNVELPLRSLFEHPTIAELATAVLAAQTAEAGPQAPAIVPIARDTHRMKRSALARHEISQSGNGDTPHEREQDNVRIAQ